MSGDCVAQREDFVDNRRQPADLKQAWEKEQREQEERARRDAERGGRNN